MKNAGFMHCSTLKLESGHGLHTSFVTHESVSAVCPKAVFKAKIVELLALALSNLVYDLANLANLANPSLGQPSHQPDET